MYDVLDICRFVILYCNEKKYSISNLRLQKLLYFIQSVFIYNGYDNCFQDDIEAWSLGPVVPRAYHEYKSCGGLDIFSQYINLGEYKEDIIKENHKKLIRDIVDKLSYYTAYDLVKITHEQTPWKEAYKENENNIIKKESLKKYFK